MNAIDEAQETGSRSSRHSGHTSGVPKLESVRFELIRKNDEHGTGAASSSWDKGQINESIPAGIFPETRPVFEAVDSSGVKRQQKEPSALMTSKEGFSHRSQDLNFPPGRGNSVLISSTGLLATEAASAAPIASQSYEDAISSRKAKTMMNEMMAEG